MEIVSNFFKRTLPVFFESLPIPDSFSGFGDLSVKEWGEFLVIVSGVGVISYVTYDYVKDKYCQYKNPGCEDITSCPVNVLKFKSDSEKVVDFVDIEDVENKVSYCRCWRSKKFPLCDGSHNDHNKETKDNVGPVVIRHKPDSTPK